MTRREFRDWLILQECIFEPLKESTTGLAVKVISPKGRETYIDMPLDDRIEKSYFICTTCVKLMIDIPKECAHLTVLEEKIKKIHYPKF